MSELNIYASKEWTALSDTDKARVIDNDFKERYSNNPDYINADAAKKDQYKNAFKRYAEESALKSEFNPYNQLREQNTREADNSGFLVNTGRIIGQSHADQFERRKFLSELNPDGTFSSNFAENVSQYAQKKNAHIFTQEQKRLANDIGELTKVLETGTTWEKAKAWGKLAVDVITNPKAVIQTGAESSSSLTAIAAGAKAGSLVLPGLGTAGGMVAATTLDAGTHKIYEEIFSTMQEQGYKMTPTNVELFLKNNPDFIKDTQVKSLQYGAALGLVDTLTAGLFSKIATLPTRAARAAAVRSMDDVKRAAIGKVAEAQGISTQRLIDSAIDDAAIQFYRARPFKQKVAGAAGSYAGEIISEPLSEAAATAFVGDEIKAEDLIYETIGGIGAGPYGAAINVAALGSKAGSKKSAEFARKILTDTPESRAQIKKLKTEAAKAKILKDARNEHDFNKDIETIEANDPRIDTWSNPEEKDYNPVKAITALAKFTDTQSADKAEEVFKTLFNDLIDTNEKAIDLSAKGENATPQEVAALKVLQQQANTKEAIVEQAYKQLQIIRERNNKAAADKEVTPIDLDTSSSEQVLDYATQTFGSHKSSLKIDQLNQRLARADLPATERSVLESMKEAEVARAVIQDSIKNGSKDKSMAEVQNDIYRGARGSEFKGIDSYKAAISNYLDPKVNNVAEATKQIEGLKKFRDSHQEKLKKLSEAFEKIKKVKYDPQTQDRPALQVKVGNRVYKIHEKSGRLIESISNETTALQKEVKAAESLLAARTTPTKANTQAATPSPVQSQPEAPVADKSTATTGEAGSLGLDVERFNKIPASRKPIALENAKKLKAAGINPNEMWGKTQPQIDRLIKEKTDAKVQTKEQTQTKEQVAPKQAPEKPQEQRSEADPAPTIDPKDTTTGTTQEVVQNNEEILSTNLNNTDNVSDINIEQIDPGYMLVTYTDVDGTQVTKPYNEAIIDITEQIEEVKKIKECIKRK